MYYLALVAPEDINRSVLTWKLFFKERYQCMAALRSPAHITLIPPFWMNADLEALLKQALVSFSCTHKSFPIWLKGFGAFPPRVIFIQVEKNPTLELVQASLQNYLLLQTIFPIQKNTAVFHPHITLATRDLHKHFFAESWKIIQNKKFESHWEATEISLLRRGSLNWEIIFSSKFC